MALRFVYLWHTSRILQCINPPLFHGRFSSVEARKSAHLRVNAIAFIPGMTRDGVSGPLQPLIMFSRIPALAAHSRFAATAFDISDFTPVRWNGTMKNR